MTRNSSERGGLATVPQLGRQVARMHAETLDRCDICTVDNGMIWHVQQHETRALGEVSAVGATACCIKRWVRPGDLCREYIKRL